MTSSHVRRVAHVVALGSAKGLYGGPFTVASEQVRGLNQRGTQATLLAGCLDETDRPRDVADARYFPATYSPALGFATLRSPDLLRTLREDKSEYDVVHVHLGRDLLVSTVPAIVGRESAVVAQTHGMVVSSETRAKRLADRVYRRLWRRVAVFIALNDQEAGQLVEYGVPAERIVTLPNAVSLRPLRERFHREHVRVVTASRLHPRKRVEDLVDACVHLRRQGLAIELDVYGPDEGAASATAGRIPTEFKSVFRLRGAVDRGTVLDALDDADLFVLPSVAESYGMALVEAMAAGLPSVCTTGCALAPQLVSDGAAVVVEPGPQSLASAIAELARAPAEAEQLGRRARAWVAENASVEEVSSRLVGIYREALTGAPVQ